MDDLELRDLCRRLLGELAGVVPDPDARRAVADELDGALGGTDADAMLDALTSTPATREWYRDHAPIGIDATRGFQPLPGDASVRAVYYVCPNGDTDVVLPTRPAVPPRCPRDGAEMLTEG